MTDETTYADIAADELSRLFDHQIKCIHALDRLVNHENEEVRETARRAKNLMKTTYRPLDMVQDVIMELQNIDETPAKGGGCK